MTHESTELQADTPHARASFDDWFEKKDEAMREEIHERMREGMYEEKQRPGAWIFLPGLAGVMVVALWMWTSLNNDGASLGASSGASNIKNAQPSTIKKLPSYGAVPEFEFAERGGQSVSPQTLRGSIWVGDFIFTRCSGPCPTLSLRMRSLQESLKKQGYGPDEVKLVSFALDPVHDTPEVLSAYADKHSANPEQWWFLTCDDEKKMHTVVRDGFHQTVLRTVQDGTIVHSTYFLLIDKVGEIRGIYEGMKSKTNAQILSDVKTLLSSN